jgi:hypothetical protein
MAIYRYFEYCLNAKRTHRVSENVDTYRHDKNRACNTMSFDDFLDTQMIMI